MSDKVTIKFALGKNGYDPELAQRLKGQVDAALFSGSGLTGIERESALRGFDEHSVGKAIDVTIEHIDGGEAKNRLLDMGCFSLAEWEMNYGKFYTIKVCYGITP